MNQLHYTTYLMVRNPMSVAAKQLMKELCDTSAMHKECGPSQEEQDVMAIGFFHGVGWLHDMLIEIMDIKDEGVRDLATFTLLMKISDERKRLSDAAAEKLAKVQKGDGQ